MSIVIPAFNAARYLPEMLASVRGQTIEDWELVVVDDCSTDGTRKIAESWAQSDDRIRCLSLSQNSGSQCRPNNIGLAATDRRSLFVAFPDADDVWEPDALERLIDALNRDPDAVAAHGCYRDIDACSRPTGIVSAMSDRYGVVGERLVRAGRKEPTTFSMLALLCWIFPPGAALVRRSTLQAAGPWDGTLKVGDWDMWARVSRLGHFAVVDRVVVNYRRHGSQVSSRGLEEPNRVVRRKLVQSSENTAAQRRIAIRAEELAPLISNERVVRRARRRWAHDKLRRGDVLGAAAEIGRLGASYARSLRTSYR